MRVSQLKKEKDDPLRGEGVGKKNILLCSSPCSSPLYLTLKRREVPGSVRER